MDPHQPHCVSCGARLPSPDAVCPRCEGGLSPRAPDSRDVFPDEVTFWNAVRRWQNLFFLWWLSWPLAGGVVEAACWLLAGRNAPPGLMVAFVLIWAVAWRYFKERLCSLRCPRCGQPAIGHPYFLMRYAKCRECGLAYRGQ